VGWQIEWTEPLVIRLPEALTRQEEDRFWESVLLATSRETPREDVTVDMSQVRYMTMEQCLLLVKVFRRLRSLDVRLSVTWPRSDPVLRTMHRWGVPGVIEQAAGPDLAATFPTEYAARLYSRRTIPDVSGQEVPLMDRHVNTIVHLDLTRGWTQHVFSPLAVAADSLWSSPVGRLSIGTTDRFSDLSFIAVWETLANIHDHGGAWGLVGIGSSGVGPHRVLSVSFIDAGSGIAATLREAVPDYAELGDREALALAMRPGISRYPGEGRGMGLHEASQHTLSAGGGMRVRSGQAVLSVGRRHSDEYVRNQADVGGTQITFEYPLPEQ
jgi:anti-anti-sigma regulatory factor